MKHLFSFILILAAFAQSFGQDVVKLKAKDLQAGQIVIADTLENGVIRFVTRQLSDAMAEAGAPTGVTEYTALLSQSGTGAPTQFVAVNTFSDSIIWTRSAQGVYIGTLAGAFTVKTVVFATFGTTGVDGYRLNAWRNDANTVYINCFDNAGAPADMDTDKPVSVMIRKYD